MRLRSTILLLAAGHALNDLVAGYFLGTLVQSMPDLFKAAAGLIIYNLLAFGGQYPAAIVIEKRLSPKQALMLSYAMNSVAIPLFTVAPQFSIILAGIASALYHVAGGSVCAQTNSAFNIGLFAGPGVAGLIAGGYFAYKGWPMQAALLVCSVLFFILLIKWPDKYEKDKRTEAAHGSKRGGLLPDRHDVVMMCLLTIISFRSVIWNVFQLIHEENYYWLIAIAVSALIGKIAGGWIADRIGWRLYMIISLVVATPLLTLFKKEMVLFCVGIGLLQSGIPATTALLISTMRGSRERAIALSFGVSIILAALIFYTPARVWLISDEAVCLAAFVIFLLMLFVARRRHRSGTNLA